MSRFANTLWKCTKITKKKSLLPDEIRLEKGIWYCWVGLHWGSDSGPWFSFSLCSIDHDMLDHHKILHSHKWCSNWSDPTKKGAQTRWPFVSLLFTLCMEYFSRAMKLVGTHPDFQFHPRCRNLKLNHLCFANDLLMFCKGDKESVQLLLSSFARFSSTTGLQVNPAKSSIYCCGGTVSLREELVSVSGFGKGVLPFRYLGVPISTKNLNAADCELLVEKMVTKIKIWSSRHLSFAGRAQLINSVLMSICSY